MTDNFLKPGLWKVTAGPTPKMIKKLIVSDGVKRHLQQEHPIDIRNLDIEDQPSRQRKRFIKRQLMKKFKNEKRK